MQANHKEMRFPVILFSKNEQVLSLPSMAKLCTISYNAWRKGVYQDIIVVDSDGRGWHVREAQKTGYPGLFGYSLLYKRRVKVKLVFGSGPREVPLSEVKQRVRKGIVKHKGYWAGQDLHGLLGEIDSARTHEEIIKKLL